MEYKIVSTQYVNCGLNAETTSLEELVRDQMAKGFVPIGGPVVSQGTQSGAYWAQAMIRSRHHPQQPETSS